MIHDDTLVLYSKEMDYGILIQSLYRLLLSTVIISIAIYNLCTALCANSQEEAERLVGKVNNIGKARLLKLNVKKTKLLISGKMQSDAGVTEDDEQIEVVEHFKYLGSLKSADGNCGKDT